MYQGDFEPFSAKLRQLAEVFPKDLSDDMLQVYWSALKDQPIGTVLRMAEQHARHGKFFPKPSELRPKEERPDVTRTTAGEGAFKEGESRCVRNLEELRRLRPVDWQSEVRLRRLDRLIATTEPSSPAYDRIACEWRDARGIHVGQKERHG